MSEHPVLKTDKLGKKFKSHCDGLKKKEVYDPDERRDKFRTFLKAFKHHDECYTEISLSSGQIEWSDGVKKWLGHNEPEFGATSLDYMEQFVHPLVGKWYSHYVKAIILAFANRETVYLKSRFVITVPMRNHENKYMLVKVMSMPFGKSEDDKLISLINSFTICGLYQGEAMKAEFFDEDKKIDESDNSYHEFRKSISDCMFFEQGDFLTPNCFKYARVIHELILGQKEVNLKNIWYRFRTKYQKTVKEEAVEKGIRRMHERLTGLMGFDKLTNAEIGPWDAFRPGNANPFPLINYCVESGFIDIFKSYKKK